MELIVRTTGGEVPIWGSAQVVRDLFGIGHRALGVLVEEGRVRSRKMPGDPVRAGRIYKIQGAGSVEAWLEEGETVAGGSAGPGDPDVVAVVAGRPGGRERHERQEQECAR